MAVYKLSRMQNTTLNHVRGFHEVGATIYDLEKSMQLSKATIYKHLDKLLEVKAVQKVYKIGDKKAYYTAGDSSAMHMLPAMGEDIPSIPVASFLSEWKLAGDLKDWSMWLHVRSLPWLVSSMAQFAWRWKSDETNDFPDKDEVEKVRRSLVRLSQRADYLSNVCQSLLMNESLWDKRKAYSAWYEDDSVPFSPETAKKIHRHITDLMGNK